MRHLRSVKPWQYDSRTYDHWTHIYIFNKNNKNKKISVPSKEVIKLKSVKKGRVLIYYRGNFGNNGKTENMDNGINHIYEECGKGI